MTLRQQPLDHLPHDFPAETFHALVRQCREQHGLSQEAFAALFNDGIDQSTIARWESGKRRSGRSDRRLPRYDLLLQLADVCAVPPGRLLDLLGYWGSRADPEAWASRANVALQELIAAARPLSTAQLRALIAVARQMRG